MAPDADMGIHASKSDLAEQRLQLAQRVFLQVEAADFSVEELRHIVRTIHPADIPGSDRGVVDGTGLEPVTPAV